ncbi:type VI secretion system tip protein TssI/VgrG [uncultured Cohaesibacter sp.]|uniref:type VI secretion system tip protein TssI/VgrG n=1 Tax=uncultured Cohaesibacter sp. TaxID=1002546 RepID=UPI0029301EC8|nr:type VI secretion system tip protein TssI/VgrG [uncultured Cohaesibacter sp.]
MAMSINSNAPHFSIDIKYKDHHFDVLDFRLDETVNEPFELYLKLVCRDWIGPDEQKRFLRAPVSLTLDTGDIPRSVQGIVGAIGDCTSIGRKYVYQVWAYPLMWHLTHKADVRNHMAKSVPDLIQETLYSVGYTAADFDLRLRGTYEKRDYCVHYRETHLAFINRLMAEEGMFYFFEHDEKQNRMVIADHAETLRPIDGNPVLQLNPGGRMVPEEEAVYHYTTSVQLRPGRFATSDYLPKKPGLDLKTHADAQRDTDRQIYDPPGLYQDADKGRRLAAVRLEQVRRTERTGKGKSVCPRLCPGHTFTLEGADAESANGDWLVTSVRHRGRQPQVLGEDAGDRPSGYVNTFKTVPANVAPRPAYPPQKRLVEGIQTAFVTGPEGEEIHTDELGRVRVKFHWDRVNKSNEKTSIPIRCSQPFTGSNWGAIFTPRIGHEVVVKFAEGDPDRPVVVGSVYHGTNVPPYKLPDEKTLSCLKSDTSPGGGGCNEIRFQDLKGKEELFIQAQRDMDVHVKHDRKTHTGRDTHETIAGSHYEKTGRDRHEKTGGNETTRIDADYHRHIGGDRSVSVSGNDSLRVMGNRVEKGRLGISKIVAGTHSVTMDEGVLQSVTELTLKVGDSFLFLNPAGVFFKAKKINIKSGGSPLSAKPLETVIPGQPYIPITVHPCLAGSPAKPASDKQAPAQPAQPQKPERIVPAGAAPAPDPDETDWVEVQILDPQGNPVPGKHVYITGANDKQYSATTNADGLCRINAIAPGECTFDIDKLDKDLWGPQGSTENVRLSRRQSGTTPYKVQSGDTLPSIAGRHNTHWRLIWDHPDNADLREKRKEPNVLLEKRYRLHPGC